MVGLFAHYSFDAESRYTRRVNKWLIGFWGYSCRHLQHSLQRFAGFGHKVIGQDDFRGFIPHAEVDFVHGVEFHVRAVVAGASAIQHTGDFMEGAAWGGKAHLVDNAWLGQHDKLLARELARILDEVGS